MWCPVDGMFKGSDVAAHKLKSVNVIAPEAPGRMPPGMTAGSWRQAEDERQ
jgi:hypothetical protein